MIDGESAAIAGPYAYSFDTNQTGSVTAAAGSARIDRLDVQVSDPAESDGSSVPSIAIIYTAGTAGSGVPAAAPARTHKLLLINVPASGGGSPTVSWAPDWSGDPGEWTFNTIAERDAYVTAIVSSNVPPQQQAVVLADPAVANNTVHSWTGSGWQRGVVRLSHAEYTTSVTGLPDGSSFSSHNFTLDSTQTTDSVFAPVSSSVLTLQPGVYALDWAAINSTAITGASVLVIRQNANAATDVQASIATGTDRGSVALPNLYAAAATTVQLIVSKTSGGNSTFTGRLRVTRIGG